MFSFKSTPLIDEVVPFALIPEGSRRTRLVVAVTGATGTSIAVRLLQVLRALDIEIHLIMSKWACSTLRTETPYTPEDVRALADYSYAPGDLAAPPSSGSFLHDGMIIVPCSMKTLAAVRIGFGDDLIARSADVCLKEGKKLLLAVRETPLSDVHLENMLFLRRAGAIIFPPLPAYYIRPQSVDDLVNQTVGRLLDSSEYRQFLSDRSGHTHDRVCALGRDKERARDDHDGCNVVRASERGG